MIYVCSLIHNGMQKCPSQSSPQKASLLLLEVGEVADKVHDVHDQQPQVGAHGLQQGGGGWAGLGSQDVLQALLHPSVHKLVQRLLHTRVHHLQKNTVQRFPNRGHFAVF